MARKEDKIEEGRGREGNIATDRKTGRCGTEKETDRQTDRQRAGTRKEMDAGQKGPRVFRLPQRPLVDTDKCPSGIFSTTGESVSVSC